MIVKKSRGSSSNALFVIPEDADDLFALRRLLLVGDNVSSDTTRVIKQTKEYTRPDKGERVKVRVSLRLAAIGLDNVVERLRISGVITNTDNELVRKGSHHSISVQAGDALTIEKERKWQDSELSILSKSANSEGFVLVAIDTQEAAVAKVTGTHVKIIPNIYSRQSGKRYQKKNNPSMETFFSEIAKTVTSIRADNDRVVVYGPGETRRKFFNLLMAKYGLPIEKMLLIDGVEVAGEDGIFVFLRSTALKQAMSTSKLAVVSSILEQTMLHAQRGEPKYAMGMPDVSNAVSLNAAESIVFSDSIFNTVGENELVNLLNRAESLGSKTYAVDSSTDIGLRVSSLGGIIAVLRYAVR